MTCANNEHQVKNTLFVCFFPMQIYTDWANHFLEKAGRRNLIADLQVDITNGVLLAQVIEAVSKYSPKAIYGENGRGLNCVDINWKTCLVNNTSISLHV